MAKPSEKRPSDDPDRVQLVTERLSKVHIAYSPSSPPQNPNDDSSTLGYLILPDSPDDAGAQARRHLLDQFPDPELISFLHSAAAADPAVRACVSSAADSNVRHRRILVQSLGLDATAEALHALLSPFGPIEDCTVIARRGFFSAGDSMASVEGYGFVVFERRSSALDALQEPAKKFNGRRVTCQLACVRRRPDSSVPVLCRQKPDEFRRNVLEPFSRDQLIALLSDAADADPDLLARIQAADDAHVRHRKILVTGLKPQLMVAAIDDDCDLYPGALDKLKHFFARFGEVECGPTIGSDYSSGADQVWATFVYKTREGAERALEEPHQVFDGCPIHCKLAPPNCLRNGTAAGTAPSPALVAQQFHFMTQQLMMQEASRSLKKISFGPIHHDCPIEDSSPPSQYYQNSMYI